MSLPTRERGLKLKYLQTGKSLTPVAPHAGAWIETIDEQQDDEHVFVAPHAGAWIETANGSTSTLSSRVAPHAGAWIETSISIQ